MTIQELIEASGGEPKKLAFPGMYKLSKPVRLEPMLTEQYVLVDRFQGENGDMPNTVFVETGIGPAGGEWVPIDQFTLS